VAICFMCPECSDSIPCVRVYEGRHAHRPLRPVPYEQNKREVRGGWAEVDTHCAIGDGGGYASAGQNSIADLRNTNDWERRLV
jgi:hypothetical protein